MSSRAASGRKKLAKAGSKDAKGATTIVARHTSSVPMSPNASRLTGMHTSTPPALTFDASRLAGAHTIPAARVMRPSSPVSDTEGPRSPFKMFSNSGTSGRTSLPQSPLRMESTLSPSVSQPLQLWPSTSADLALQAPTRQSSSLASPSVSSTRYPPSHSGSSSSESCKSVRTPGAPPSTFSSSSGSTDSPPPAAAFVFPSSRSRGHPSLTASGKVPKLKFQSKKSKGKQVQGTDYPSSITSGSSGATMHYNDPASPPLSAYSLSPRSLSANAPASPPSRSSSDVSSGFVFPVSRSRAHPVNPPPKLKLPGRKKTKSSSGSSDSNGRARFMGIPITKKKKTAGPTIVTSAEYTPASTPSSLMHRSFDDVSLIGSSFGQYEESIRSSWIPTAFPTKQDVYPLDPYDGALLDQDRLTTGLLRRLNASEGPSFHHYGNDPPTSVLDLGCGQGHWLLDAAVAWRGYGTRITGFDMVDMTKALRPAAVKNGVVDNINIVRGNFLKERLPFPDESFDLVRMANLTYAIPFEKWELVLKEACRVLTVGGRLEMVDDHIFFPYGKAPHQPVPNEEDVSDTATLGAERRQTWRNGNLPPTSSSSMFPTESDRWTEQAGAARELESLFEHMHNMKFGIHLCPTQFIVDMMEQVFGHANEIRTMHLTLAPPCPTDYDSKEVASHTVHPLRSAPGLMLWPTTFIPMTQAEIELHALRHPRVLLSLKSSLIEYAIEMSDEEEVDKDAVKESLWEYEGFLYDRFDPPQRSTHTTSTSANNSAIDIAAAWHSRQGSQGSLDSMASVSDEGQRALQQYQQELMGHMTWTTNSDSDGEDIPATPRQAGTPTQELELPDNASSHRAPSFTSLPSFSTSAHTSTTSMHSPPPPPDYSRYEQTHIRTFHVFEAIKMDETLLGAAI